MILIRLLSSCEHQLYRLRDSDECTDFERRRKLSRLNDDSRFQQWLVSLWEQK